MRFLLLLLTSTAWSQVSNLPVEDMEKDGALQAIHQGMDDKFQTTGGTITGRTSFTGTVTMSSTLDVTGNVDVATGSKVQENGADLIPAGAIFLWDASTNCPSGYTEVTGMRNRYPIGTDVAAGDANVPDTSGQTGGATTHAHSTPNHQHDLEYTSQAGKDITGAEAASTDSSGASLVEYDPSGTGVTVRRIKNRTENSGSGTSGAGNNYPALYTVLFCKKD